MVISGTGAKNLLPQCPLSDFRVEKSPRPSENPLNLLEFFMKFRGPKAHPNKATSPQITPPEAAACQVLPL